jgi:hypothetical protein
VFARDFGRLHKICLLRAAAARLNIEPWGVRLGHFAREVIMFEVPIDKQETKSEYERIGIAVLVLLLIAGAAYYFISKNNGPTTKPRLTQAIVPTGPADPVKDLKIIHASMNKDSMGVTAVWLVTLHNLSNAYTYSEIKYETSYFSADNRQLLVNQGTIKETFSPGDELNSEIRDTQYPDGTAWFKFKILSAKSAVVQ